MEDALNSTQPLEELKQQETELKEKIERNQAMIDDSDASPSEKEAAREWVVDNQERARLQTQILEREASLPFRERIKEIFKKYSVTVTAIVLAAGVTIGGVVGVLTNSLKALGKGVGNRLKEIGSRQEKPAKEENSERGAGDSRKKKR